MEHSLEGGATGTVELQAEQGRPQRRIRHGSRVLCYAADGALLFVPERNTRPAAGMDCAARRSSSSITKRMPKRPSLANAEGLRPPNTGHGARSHSPAARPRTSVRAIVHRHGTAKLVVTHRGAFLAEPRARRHQPATRWQSRTGRSGWPRATSQSDALRPASGRAPSSDRQRLA
jgi:hypothetical protein